VLNKDVFHGVRSEAAKALKKMNTPEARAHLARSLAQPDARVRREVVEALLAFPHPEAWEALAKQAAIEKNPEVLAAIIKTWSQRPGDAEITAALVKHLESNTYWNTVAAAAIATFRAQDDASAVPAILARLQRTPLEFDPWDQVPAMEALGFLARDEKHPQRNAVLAYLTGHLNHPKESLRVGAAKSLGLLRDPRALAWLAPLASSSKPFKDPVREAAEKSITALEAAQAGPQQMKDVWSKLQELQKKSEDLQRQLEKMPAK
jgi:aminopeptidase N